MPSRSSAATASTTSIRWRSCTETPRSIRSTRERPRSSAWSSRVTWSIRPRRARKTHQCPRSVCWLNIKCCASFAWSTRTASSASYIERDEEELVRIFAIDYIQINKFQCVFQRDWVHWFCDTDWFAKKWFCLYSFSRFYIENNQLISASCLRLL